MRGGVAFSPLSPKLTQISPLDCYVESLSQKESDQQHNTTTINLKLQSNDTSSVQSNDITSKIDVNSVQSNDITTSQQDFSELSERVLKDWDKISHHFLFL